MSAPAGWYRDNNSPERERFWNGAQWTEHSRPAVAQAAASQGWGAAPAGTPTAPVWTSPPAGPASQKNWFLRNKILTGIGAFLLLGIFASTTGGGGSAGTDNASDNEPVAAPSAPAAPPAPVPRAIGTSCIQLFGGLGGAVVQKSDADTGCLDQADVRLYPSLRKCTDGRTYLSLHEFRLERIYFGFVGEGWQTIKATQQNLALLDAARRECSG